MFLDEKICRIREEKIQTSQLAKEHLQMAVEVGHFRVCESYIEHFKKTRGPRYLVLYISAGNAILASQQRYEALSCAFTLIKKLDDDFSVFLDDCEAYYAILEGNSIAQCIQRDQAIFDMRFSKKTEIFFHSIFQSIDKYHIIDEFSISSAVLRLYSDLHIELFEVKQLSDKHDMIDAALTFMEKNYQHDIKLKDIAEASGYSEYYFLRTFKHVMRMTPYEYLVRKRLSQVKILLLSTDKTIEEIALLCGFKSDVSLYKTFKNTYSITPRDYKKTICK